MIVWSTSVENPDVDLQATPSACEEGDSAHDDSEDVRQHMRRLEKEDIISYFVQL